MESNHAGRQSRLIEALSPRERARVDPLLEPVELKTDDLLESAGHPIRYAVFPVNAVTSTLMELPEGDTVEVGLMGAEGVVGLSRRRRTPYGPPARSNTGEAASRSASAGRCSARAAAAIRSSPRLCRPPEASRSLPQTAKAAEP